MKLRHQISLLLLIPLVLQLITTIMIFATYARIDEVAKRESIAKKVVNNCKDAQALLGQIALVVVAPGFFQSASDIDHLAPLSKKLSRSLAQLQDLSRNNPKAAKLTTRLSANVDRLVRDIKDLAGSYSTSENRLIHSVYLEGTDFIESTKVLFDTVLFEVIELGEIYGPEAQEFSPASVAARRDIRTAVLFAVFANVLLVIALAVVINKKTLARLEMLMANMAHFAEGSVIHSKLDGQDEIAELDAAFQKMAHQRNRLDEIRKSMRAMVSHDLRSPLTAISLGLEVILDDSDLLPNEITKRVKRLYSEAGRLKRLADTLLDIEKIEDGTIEVHVSESVCAEIVETAVNALSSQIERKKLTIETSLSNAVLCKCDQERTIQILVNLISNAIKFSPPQSKITINAISKHSELVRFEVIDEGPGVPHDKVGELFNKFSQLDQPSEIRKEGSGLGLYICKMLTSAQNGQIGYDAGVERGSCFWLELPAVANQENLSSPSI